LRINSWIKAEFHKLLGASMRFRARNAFAIDAVCARARFNRKSLRNESLRNESFENRKCSCSHSERNHTLAPTNKEFKRNQKLKTPNNPQNAAI